MEYEKFRKYILKTSWCYDIDYPPYEELVREFRSIEDLDRVNHEIVYLLQLGFRVYCSDYVLDAYESVESDPEKNYDSIFVNHE